MKSIIAQEEGHFAFGLQTKNQEVAANMKEDSKQFDLLEFTIWTDIVSGGRNELGGCRDKLVADFECETRGLTCLSYTAT